MCACFCAGEWRWLDGTPWTFTAWGRGEPDNADSNWNYANRLYLCLTDPPEESYWDDQHMDMLYGGHLCICMRRGEGGTSWRLQFRMGMQNVCAHTHACL